MEPKIVYVGACAMEQKNKKFSSSISVLPTHSILDATIKLQDTKIGALPVIDGENRMVGILTVQHIIASISNGDSPSDPVENIMKAVVDEDRMGIDEILDNDKIVG